MTYAPTWANACVAVTSDRSSPRGPSRKWLPDPDQHVPPSLCGMSKEPPHDPASIKAGRSRLGRCDSLTVYALFQAEELGITQANGGRKAGQAKPNPTQAEPLSAASLVWKAISVTAGSAGRFRRPGGTGRGATTAKSSSRNVAVPLR